MILVTLHYNVFSDFDVRFFFQIHEPCKDTNKVEASGSASASWLIRHANCLGGYCMCVCVCMYVCMYVCNCSIQGLLAANHGMLFYRLTTRIVIYMIILGIFNCIFPLWSF